MTLLANAGGWRGTIRRVVMPVAAGLAIAATAPLTTAQQGAGGAAQPAAQAPANEPLRTLIAFEHGSCDDLLTSSKDAALLRALRMIPERIKEILETPGVGPPKGEIPEGAVELLTDVLTGPMRLAVTQQGFDDKTRLPKVGVALSYKCADEAAAKRMNERMENIRHAANAPFQPQPSKRFPGMQDVALPLGILSYGPRAAKDGARFEVLFGNVEDPEAVFASLPSVAPGERMFARGTIDLAAASPIMEMFGGMVAMWAPNGQEVLQQLRDSGIMGPDAMALEMVCGHSNGEFTNRFTVKRAGKFADKLGFVRSTLTDADLAVMPADSVFAAVQKIDPMGSWKRLTSSLGATPQFQEGLNEVNQHLGINVETDVIAALGSTAGVSIADSTGGNSLLSLVGYVEVKDRARLSAAIDKVASAANTAIEKEQAAKAAAGDGEPFTVRVTSFVADAGGPYKGVNGVRFTQLKFHGLPVPFEPTFAMTDKWLIVGATPQSAVSATAQALAGKAGKSGLLANPAFAKSGLDVSKGTSMCFVDSASTLRDGYPLLTMIGTALGNGVRSMSPTAGRDAGMVIPMLSELRDGAKPCLSMTHWEGDDLVMVGRGDDSILVNIAGIGGVGDISTLLFGGVVGAAIGANANGQGQHTSGHHPGHAQGADADHDEEEMDADSPEEMEAPEPPEPPDAPEAPAAAEPSKPAKSTKPGGSPAMDDRAQAA